MEILIRQCSFYHIKQRTGIRWTIYIRNIVKEKDIKVIVQCVPYYYKNIDGTFEKYIDGGMYPEYVTITPIEDYNYVNENPDVIVFQYPYDNYNSAGTTDPVFYSYNLASHTQKLIYIPYFRTDEIDENDMRAYTNMDAYVTIIRSCIRR